jgi:hypothetical protein
MSIEVMSRVWQRSRQAGGALLVLLAIADFADDRGVAYPSVPTLARKARLSERQVQRVISELVDAEELAVEPGQGRHGSHLYSVIVGTGRHDVTGDRMSPRRTVTHDRMSPVARHRRRPGVTLATSAGVTPVSPEPSSPEPSGTITPLPPSQQQGVDVDQDAPTGPLPIEPSRSPRLLVEALYRGLGIDLDELTRSMHARELTIASQLVAAGATPAEAEAYARDVGTSGNRLAPIDMRSFERERPTWLARRRLSRPGGGRYIDRTGQGVNGPPARPPDESTIDRSVAASVRPADPPVPPAGPMTDGPPSSLRPPADWYTALRQRLLGNTA